MTTVRTITMAALLALAACRPASEPVTAGQGRSAINGDASWQGESACADCAAIRTRLTLRSDARMRRYTLEEIFVGTQDMTFVSEGDWQQHNGIIMLAGDDGARLSYGVLPDGSLQPLGIGGRRMAGSDAALLTPVGQQPDDGIRAP